MSATNDGAAPGIDAGRGQKPSEDVTEPDRYPAPTPSEEAASPSHRRAPAAPGGYQDAEAIIDRLALSTPPRLPARHRIPVALFLGETVPQAYAPIVLGALCVASRLTIKLPSSRAYSDQDTAGTRLRTFVGACVDALQRTTPDAQRVPVAWLERRLDAAELDAFCAAHALVYAQGDEALLHALRQRLGVSRLIERGPAYGAAVIDLRHARTPTAYAVLAAQLAADFFGSDGLGCMHPRTAVCIGEPVECARFVEALRATQRDAPRDAPREVSLSRFALEAAARGQLFAWGAGTLAHIPSPHRLLVAEQRVDLPLHSVASPEAAAALFESAPSRIRAIATAPFPLGTALAVALSAHGNVRIAPLGALQATAHDAIDEGWDPQMLFRTRAALLASWA